MTSPNTTDPNRLSEILKLARMQLNEEYMKRYSSAHTTWLTSARTAWNTTGSLLPFTNNFVYPTEEEVVARGVKIFNTLNPQPVAAPVAAIAEPVAIAPAAVEPIAVEPVAIEPVAIEPVAIEPVAAELVELLQAGGDFVIADTTLDLVDIAEPVDVTDVEAKEISIAVEPTVADSLLENKFKSLFTKWGGRGNY